MQFDIKNATGSLITFIDDDRTVKGTTIDSLWIGQYKISVTDEKGCKADSLLEVRQGDCPVHIPNSFSPNVDGSNDFYKIFTDGNFKGKLLSFSIYNRWGTRIFHVENFKSGDDLWDGKTHDEVQSVGVFAYLLKVEFESGKAESLNGALTLVR